MNTIKHANRVLSMLLALALVFSLFPVSAFAVEADDTLTASLAEAKSYIDGITINNSSNDPETVVKNFGTHFTWDNEKRESSKSYLFDWSYYNGVVFEGIEYVYEVTGESVYKDYVIEYMSSMITSSGGWATCSNNSSKQCAGYNSTHGADCYKTASLLLDSYEMTGDSRYLTMAATLYADLDTAANSYLLSNAGYNYRHTWASDPSPDLWLDGLYMILPFRAEYAKYIGDTEELDLIVSRMQWVSDNMYDSSKGLFYHAADSASSNSGTYWLRSIGWYAAAIVDIMDSMEGENLEAMKKQLVKLVDGMKACQNSSNGMWLNNMNASQSSTNPYETSGTALTCYAVMKAVNNGWLDESYADMAILAFNGICSEKLSGSTLTDICFKGAPGSSNSTFYDNEGKGVGPFIMFYAEVLEYVNSEEEVPEETEPEVTEPEATEPEVTEPEATEPEATEPEEEVPVYQASGNLEGSAVYTLDSDGINSGEKYLIVYSGKALQNNNGVDNNPTVSISNNTITLSDDSTYAWTITQSGSSYYVENNGSYLNLTASGNDPIGSSATVSITQSGSTYKFRNTSSSGAYLRYSSSQLFCAGTSSSNNGMSLYLRTTAAGSAVVFTISPAANSVQVGSTLALNGTVTVDGTSVDLSRCTITWASSSNAVATVSGGTVTGVASGSASITATLSAVDGTALLENIVLTIPVTVKGHNYESVVTAPTCTAQGYTTHTCTVCGDSYVDGYTNALGHDYSTVVTAPTCTEGGYTIYTCSSCGDAYVADEVAALGHSYESVTVAATCTVDGSVTYTCHCGDSHIEVIEAIGHDYTCVVTAPSCTENGYTTYICGNCGDTYVADEVTALGHNYESVTAEPTCTEGGCTTYTCANCGDSYIADVVDALGHNTVSVITEATCETDGYTTHTCTVCANVTVDSQVAALGHAYETVTVEATCTQDGSVTTTCTRCGETSTEVIKATGHDYTAVVTAPTCTEGGCTTYTCACGDSYVADYIDALGHAYASVTVDATCTEDGSVTYTCACGDSYVEIIEAMGHDYEAVVTEPSCTEGGYTTNTCAGCHDSYITDETAALGHNYESVTVEPTCTENGQTTHTCTACGDSYITDEVAALGHTYESVTVDATCTEQGSVTYTCACGDLYLEVIEAIGHDFASVVTAPTCTETGFTTYTCSNCASVYVADEVDALGHTYESVTVDATCTENGSVTCTCFCGDTYTEVIEAPGHSYEAIVTAPTCTEGGYTTYTCAVCGDTSVSDEVEALGHTYESVTVDATCTEDGSVTYTCACGDSYTETIAATGHSYEAVVTAPTCTENGYTTYTCACGEAYVTDAVAALGHTYEAVTVDAACTADGSITYTCACGDFYVEVIAATGHDYTSVVTAPTCTEAGCTTHTCGNCGDSYITDEAEALGHTYESITIDASCTADGSVTYTCACGDSYTEVIEATGHSYTCTEGDGCLIYTCEACGDSYTETLASEWISLSGRYVLDTDGIDVGTDHKYILVGSSQDYALTLSGSTIGSAAVTVDGDTIVLADGSQYEFYFVNNSSKESNTYLLTQDGSNSVYHMGGNMYYGNDNKGYWYIGSASNGSYQLYDYDNLNWYLNYGYVWGSDSVSRFAVSSTARSVRLFKSVDTFARLSGQLNQTWNHADCATEDAILENISIETSTDGVNVAETIAITSDMVTWNTAFDGATAGTYTAAVTYNGATVGTITVTVTGSHVYESVVTAATCTTQGYTTYACHECGNSYTTDYIDALGHSYSGVESNGYMVYTCAACGDSYSEKISGYSQVSAFASGSNYVITLYSGSSYYALSHANNQISAVQVTVADGEITSEITSDLLWTYSDSRLSYQSGSTTYYLYSYTNGWWGGWWGNNGATLSISASNSSTVSLSSNKLKIGSYYLRYSNGSVSLYSSGTTTYLFVEN